MIEVPLTPAGATVLLTPRAAGSPPESGWWADLRRSLQAHHRVLPENAHWLVMDDVLAKEIVENVDAPGTETAAPDLKPLLDELTLLIRPQLPPPWCFPPLPAPLVTALVPATAVIGQPSFALHVQGTGFRPGAVIVFNGHDEPTTFVSETEVTTGVDMRVWTGPSLPLPVYVRNPDGQSGPAQMFTFTAA